MTRSAAEEELYQKWLKESREDLGRQVEAGLPLLKAMIENDELHNPYITMNNIHSWISGGHRIWVAEHLEQHGFTWDGKTWTRTQEERHRSWNLRYRPPEIYIYAWGPPPWEKTQQLQLI